MDKFLVDRRTVALGGASLALAGALPRSAQAQETPRRGGVLTVQTYSDLRTLNPAMRASYAIHVFTSKMVEPLVDLGHDNQPVPKLATAWESSPDGKTITFKLREGVQWHDGKPFTSADVQFLRDGDVEEVPELRHASPSKYLTAVDTPDAHTAIFRYSEPMPLGLLLRAACELCYCGAQACLRGHRPSEESGEPRRRSEPGPVQVRVLCAGAEPDPRAQSELLGAGSALSRSPHHPRNPGCCRGCRGAGIAGRPDQHVLVAAASQTSRALPRILSSGSEPKATKPIRSSIRWASTPARRSSPTSGCAAPSPMRWISTSTPGVSAGLRQAGAGSNPDHVLVLHSGRRAGLSVRSEKAEALLDEAGYKRGPDGTRACDATDAESVGRHPHVRHLHPAVAAEGRHQDRCPGL